ncbi:MAG: protein-disulfide reductase DsbD, partial [Burkholderiaceae bacterium]
LTADGLRVAGDYAVDSVPPPTDTVKPVTSTGQGADAPGVSGLLDLGDTGLAAYLGQAGWWQILLLSAALGVLLSFTPCVLPMVPILLAILAGTGTDTGSGGGPVSRWRGFSLAAMFVLGMSLVYTVLGVAAGLVGASLAVWLQTPWVLTLFAVLLALLALAMFDVFTFQAPGAMQTRLNAWMSRLPGGRYGAVFLMGSLSALIVGPCVAAPLAGVLLFISQTGDVVLGGSALFAMAWGEGLLLLAVGASSGVLLPKAGPWMNGVKWLFGMLLLATAWWMMNSVLPAWIMVTGWAVLAIWGAVMMGAFDRLPDTAGPGRMLVKGLGVLLAVWAIAMLVGLASGGRSVLQPLDHVGGKAGSAGVPAATSIKSQFVRVTSVQELDNLLANTNRPVLLDFYADWCVSCIEMEKFTFSDPVVARKMANMVLVQADVTRNTDNDRALLKRFNLFGPPGILFFNAQGRELSEPRVVGFMNADDFSGVLDTVLAQAPARN